MFVRNTFPPLYTVQCTVYILKDNTIKDFSCYYRIVLRSPIVWNQLDITNV